MKIRMQNAGAGLASRILMFALSLMLLVPGVVGIRSGEVNAAATTVTLRYGESEFYGSGKWGGWTIYKWVTHIDGEPIDLDEVPGVSRSYAYCVQPTYKPPEAGTFTVAVVDDDDTGRVSTMRKMIYYLPGSYGYTKVTKNRWFSDNNTGASAYAIGHIALSWIYDGYSESEDVWDGVGSAMKQKCKAVVSDLANLPEPPETFEVFWVKEANRQDIFGAFYAAEYGRAKIVKTSSMPHITSGNSSYSLQGAEYTIYTDDKCREAAKDANGNDAVLVTRADGNSDEITLETGDYYIKETKAPKGYELDDKIRSISISNDKTTTLNVQDVPVHSVISLLLDKSDAEIRGGTAQGDSSLASAVYKCSYYDAQYSSAAAAEASGKATATWYFKTDGSGRISGTSPATAEGYTSSELFKDGSGRTIFLLGSYVIQEVKASSGYKLNSEKLFTKISESGSGSSTASGYKEAMPSKETVIRGGVRIAKIDSELEEAYAQGDSSLAGAEFTIYNKSEEAVYVGGKSIAKDGAVMTIKTSEDGTAATANNALPYGTYLIKETSPSKGYLLNTSWSKSFSIREEAKVVDLSGDKVKEDVCRSGVQILKRDKELEKSEALGGASLEGIVMTIRNVSGHDVLVRSDIGDKDSTVDWRKSSAKDLIEKEAARRVKNGEDICRITTHWNEDKKAYTAETLADDLPYGSYTIRESRTNSSYQRTDKSEHRFEVREDGSIYSYDNGLEDILTFDNYVYRSDVQGTKIGDGDSKRFAYVPFKISSLTNGETHVVVTDANGFFSTRDRRSAGDLDEDEDAQNERKLNPFDDLMEADEIRTEDLQERSQDILQGVWFGTGEQLGTAELNPTFGALPYGRYAIEELLCEKNIGYTLQKFSFTVDEKSQNGTVDLATITDDYEEPPEPKEPKKPEEPEPEPEPEPVPEEPLIKTRARDRDSRTQTAVAGSDVTIIDEVSYENLEEGSRYIIEGVLMDKKSGEPLRSDDGSHIHGITEFTADSKDGAVEVEFNLNAEKLAGKSTVVYEYLKKDGELITSHTDIKSSSQTVHFKKPAGRKTPETGDGRGENLLWYLITISVSMAALLLTAKKRNDRLG